MLIDQEILKNPLKYTAGFQRDQTKISGRRGTYGPLGNIAANGCGSLAVHNILEYFGMAGTYGDVVRRFNRSWFRSTLCGGILGTNPWFAVRYLKKMGLHTTVHFIYGRKAYRCEPENRQAFLTVYLWKQHWKIGGHYQALVRLRSGRLESFNSPDRIYDDVQEFYKESGAVAMILVECRPALAK